MSLVMAGLISLCLIKVLSPKQDCSNEVCPTPFYGNDELANAFAEAFQRKQTNR